MLKLFTRALGVLFGALLGALGSGTAFAQAAFVEGRFVTPTLAGCKLPVGATLPSSLICADGEYTTGNLGKSWNELDLVPHRLTTSLGNQGDATTTYDVYIAGDSERGGFDGYDVMTVPVVNASKSSASCSLTYVGPQTEIAGVFNGTDKAIYRRLTISQAKGSTCVFDWVNRLAIGAAQFTGSNLQARLATQGDFGGGDRTVPLPVKEIAPQQMSKTMSATQNAERTWNVTKKAVPGSLDFGDVCKATPTLEKEVQITVTWSKLAATPSGDVKVVTNINVKNPAARTITVNVTDSVYSGQDATGTFLASMNSGDIDVAANFNGLLKTFEYTIPAAQAGNIGDYLNDKAVATYIDKVTGVPVPGTVTATAKAQIQLGTTLNETANIADKETISGTGLTFKVADPGTGSFVGYTAGNAATEVNWEIAGLNADGSVTFVKRVLLDQRRITTGELTDVATLVSTDSQFTTSGALIPVTIKSSATVSLKVHKTIPLALKDGESIVVNFSVTPAGGGAATPVSVTFNGPSAIGASAESTALTGLAPGKYIVTEGTSTFYATPSSTGVALNLVPTSPQAEVDLSPTAEGVMNKCSDTAYFVNTIPGTEFPKAKVAKSTLPAQSSGDDGWEWEFTLSGPSGFVSETVPAYAGQGFVAFAQALTEEGTYTVTETLKPKWDLTGIVQPDGSSSTTVCTFTVDFPADFGKVFGCTFTNTKRGLVKVIKTLKGQPLTTEQFTFQLRKGASTTADGTILETLTTNSGGNGSTLNFTTLLVPNTTYQMCEAVSAGWMTNLGTFVPGSFMPPNGYTPNPGVDNSILCVNFTVAPGATKTFNVDNSPPPGGRALTIGFWKNHASCVGPLKKNNATALDETLFASSGILKSSKIDSQVFTESPTTVFGLYGQYAKQTADCMYAVRLLDKRTVVSGTKKASDPLFNMVAQLVATELNLAAGAYTCPVVATTVTAAEGLLAKYGFNGNSYSPNLTKADATLANNLATKLDDYNNNRGGVCP